MTVLQEAGSAQATVEPTRRDRRVFNGRALSVAAILLTVYGLVAMIVVGRADWITDDFVPMAIAWAIGFGVFAWLALPHQPENRAVWVTAVSSALYGMGTAALGTMILIGERAGFDMAPTLEGFYGLAPAQLPTTAAICWMLLFAGWVSGLFLVLTLGFLLFPDGRPLTPGWSWAAWTAIPVVAITPIVFAWEYHPGSDIIYDAGSPSFTGIGRVSIVLVPILLVLVTVSVSSLIVGFRRSTGTTRQQYKVIAWGGGFFLTTLAAIMSTQSAVPQMTVTNELWRRYGLLLAVLVLVTSYGVAVGRYRLYGIDLVVNRTLVFVLLAGFITFVYALLVVGLGHLIGGREGLALPIAATAIVAVAFEPVRQGAQKWANRVVYGRRATPYEVLSDLTARLAASEEGAGILSRMAQLIHDGTGAERATVWLGPPGDMRSAASWPADATIEATPDLDTQNVFPVHHDTDVVGALEVVMAQGSVMSHQERALILDVAGSAGLVLGYQRLNDSLAQRALEVKDSRARLVGAQDDERRRLERELRDGAQKLIVALKTKISDASRLANEHHATELGALLASLEEDSQLALDEISSLAKGIYPPVLVSKGLPASVSGLASGAPVDVEFSYADIGRYQLEVEAAVFFNISEAVTNAVKHAHPPIVIELTESAGMLGFTVSDGGPGFDTGNTPHGSGLDNMEDRMDAVGGRLHVESQPSGRTVVSGQVAVGERASV